MYAAQQRGTQEQCLRWLRSGPAHEQLVAAWWLAERGAESTLPFVEDAILRADPLQLLHGAGKDASALAMRMHRSSPAARELGERLGYAWRRFMERLPLERQLALRARCVRDPGYPWRVRLSHAAQLLIRMGLLRQSDPEERSPGAWAGWPPDLRAAYERMDLPGIEAGARALLLGALRSPDPFQRLAAVCAWGQCAFAGEAGGGVEGLAALLHDPDPLVRSSADAVLSKLNRQ